MITRSLLTFTLALCSAATLLPSIVSAQTPLNRATIQNLRNKVDLTAKQQTRPAQKADVMTPGDALRTYRQAMAELRFNDNSLARLGEQALFQFMPNSRNFDLQQGTVLLFITPGQGRTRIRTPNAAAGIRGSALFVRYIPDSKVTLIGALTNSGIEISNGDACNSSQTVALKAGQLGYVFNCQIGIYNFDLRKFQETSPLFKEANLDQNPEVSAEISQALSEQGTFVGNSESNPDWTKIAENRQTSPVAARPTNAKDLASIPFQPQVDATQVSKINSAAASAASSPSAAASVAPPAAIVTIVRPPEIPAAAAPASTSLPSPPNDRPTPVTAPPISAPNTPSASVPERPTPPVQVPVTPTTSVTPTTPPTSAYFSDSSDSDDSSHSRHSSHSTSHWRSRSHSRHSRGSSHSRHSSHSTSHWRSRGHSGHSRHSRHYCTCGSASHYTHCSNQSACNSYGDYSDGNSCGYNSGCDTCG
ncbi:MAG: hypothetical protein OHK0047_31090 [Leptolyngbyaceae cyanobacterium]